MLRVAQRNFFSKWCGNPEVTKLLHSMNLHAGSQSLISKRVIVMRKSTNGVGDFVKTVVLWLRRTSPVDKNCAGVRKQHPSY